MAEYTQTISENINLWGVAPSNKWNEYNWGAFLWGEGTNKVVTKTNALLSDATAFTDSIPLKIENIISDSTALADGVPLKIENIISESTALTDGAPQQIQKTISESTALADGAPQEIESKVSESTALVDGAPQEIESKVSESLAPTSDMSSETLQESKDWFYVTPSNDTNYESRDIASFTSGTLPGSTYSSQAAGSTTWT